MYLVAKSVELSLIKDIIGQIVEKEMLINTQIENFLADIKSNNISFTTTAATLLRQI